MKFIINTITLLISLAFLLLVFVGCEKEYEDPRFPPGDLISEGPYSGEYWPTQGWRSCRPEEVGMDAEKLKALNEEILILQRLHVEINGVLIIKNGYIIAEQYYSEDYTLDSLHPIYSCTKSITSALVGIALNEHYLTGLDQALVDFFPEYEIDNMSPEKMEITLEHMLTMTTGLEWYEFGYSYDDERNTWNDWISSEDRVKFLLDRPMVTIPGEEFNYNTGVSHTLSAILQKVTGKRTDLLAEEKIFSPLGISNYKWFVDPAGIAAGGHAVRLTPRDMAKFGYLYLNNGEWEESQVIPEDWVQTATQKHVKRKYIPDYYYGYHWWVSSNNYYSAVGHAGQWIFIVPDMDLVVVFTNQLNEEDYLQISTPERLLNTYIIPAAI